MQMKIKGLRQGSEIASVRNKSEDFLLKLAPLQAALITRSSPVNKAVDVKQSRGELL